MVKHYNDQTYFSDKLRNEAQRYKDPVFLCMFQTRLTGKEIPLLSQDTSSGNWSFLTLCFISLFLEKWVEQLLRLTLSPSNFWLFIGILLRSDDGNAFYLFILGPIGDPILYIILILKKKVLQRCTSYNNSYPMKKDVTTCSLECTEDQQLMTPHRCNIICYNMFLSIILVIVSNTFNIFEVNRVAKLKSWTAAVIQTTL